MAKKEIIETLVKKTSFEKILALRPSTIASLLAAVVVLVGCDQQRSPIRPSKSQTSFSGTEVQSLENNREERQLQQQEAQAARDHELAQQQFAAQAAADEAAAARADAAAARAAETQLQLGLADKQAESQLALKKEDRAIAEHQAELRDARELQTSADNVEVAKIEADAQKASAAEGTNQAMIGALGQVGGAATQAALAPDDPYGNKARAAATESDSQRRHVRDMREQDRKDRELELQLQEQQAQNLRYIGSMLENEEARQSFDTAVARARAIDRRAQDEVTYASTVDAAAAARLLELGDEDFEFDANDPEAMSRLSRYGIDLSGVDPSELNQQVGQFRATEATREELLDTRAAARDHASTWAARGGNVSALSDRFTDRTSDIDASEIESFSNSQVARAQLPDLEARRGELVRQRQATAEDFETASSEVERLEQIKQTLEDDGNDDTKFTPEQQGQLEAAQQEKEEASRSLREQDQLLQDVDSAISERQALLESASQPGTDVFGSIADIGVTPSSEPDQEAEEGQEPAGGAVVAEDKPEDEPMGPPEPKDEDLAEAPQPGDPDFIGPLPEDADVDNSDDSVAKNVRENPADGDTEGNGESPVDEVMGPPAPSDAELASRAEAEVMGPPAPSDNPVDNAFAALDSAGQPAGDLDSDPVVPSKPGVTAPGEGVGDLAGSGVPQPGDDDFIGPVASASADATSNNTNVNTNTNLAFGGGGGVAPVSDPANTSTELPGADRATLPGNRALAGLDEFSQELGDSRFDEQDIVAGAESDGDDVTAGPVNDLINGVNGLGRSLGFNTNIPTITTRKYGCTGGGGGAGTALEAQIASTCNSAATGIGTAADEAAALVKEISDLKTQLDSETDEDKARDLRNQIKSKVDEVKALKSTFQTAASSLEQIANNQQLPLEFRQSYIETANASIRMYNDIVAAAQAAVDGEDASEQVEVLENAGGAGTYAAILDAFGYNSQETIVSNSQLAANGFQGTSAPELNGPKSKLRGGDGPARALR